MYSQSRSLSSSNFIPFNIIVHLTKLKACLHQPDNGIINLHALGLVPAVILSLFKAAETGQNFWIVLITCLAVFLIVQIIQDLVLTPKIMGDAVGLPPFLILLSLSVWGFMLGIIGMIIALPLTTIIISYYKRYVSESPGKKTVDSKQ